MTRYVAAIAQEDIEEGDELEVTAVASHDAHEGEVLNARLKVTKANDQ